MHACPACGFSLEPLVSQSLPHSFCPRCGAPIFRKSEKKTRRLEKSDAQRREEHTRTLEPNAPASDDLAPDMPADASPTEKSIAGHELKGVLGSGGMGMVHLAHEPGVERDVALKVLLPRSDLPTKHSSAASRTARFIEEAQVSGQLQHPGVIPVYRLGRDEHGRYYYTMRPITEGRTLRDIFSELREDDGAGEKWSIRRLVEILRSVCLTVAYAHKRGALHRDLKPANIVVGDYGEVLVIDWGLTKVLGSSGGEVVEDVKVGHDSQIAEALRGHNLTTVRSSSSDDLMMTLDGAVMGTPAYMSPEQASSESKSIGPATDIYALGSILYEILTLTSPYQENNLMALLYAVWNGKLESPYDRAPDREIPDELVLIARRALSIEPEGRHESAQEMADDLAAWLEGRPEWRVVMRSDLRSGDALKQWTDARGETTGLWRAGDGVLEAIGEADQEHILLSNERFVGDLRMYCTAWCEKDRPTELSIYLCSEDAETAAVTDRDGYCFQFGGDGVSVTKLARHRRDVLTVEEVAPDPGRKYRVLAEAVGGVARFLIDDEEVFRWKDPRPLSGGHVGFYAWGPGAKFADICIESRGKQVTVSILDVPESHFSEEQYEKALALYRDIAASHPTRAEGAKAEYMSGLCMLRLGTISDAKKLFSELEHHPRTAPYGVLGAVRVIEEEEGEEAAARHLLSRVERHDWRGRRWREVATYALDKAVDRYGRDFYDEVYPIWFESALSLDQGRSGIAGAVSPDVFKNLMMCFIRPKARKILSAHPDADDRHPGLCASTVEAYGPEVREDAFAWVRQERFGAGCDTPKEVEAIRGQIRSRAAGQGKSDPEIEEAIADLTETYPSLPHLAHHLRRDLEDARRAEAPHGGLNSKPPHMDLMKEIVAVNLADGGVSQHASDGSSLDDACRTTRLILRRVPAGTFTMGDSTGKGDEEERPVHQVTLTRDFYLGVFPVTQRQWYEMMGHWPGHFSDDREKLPVERLSWLDTRPFLERLSYETGLRFTLPTEAQWEYACRAGTVTDFSCGNQLDAGFAWWAEGSAGRVHEVGLLKPNAWGIYDMHGCVWEWCADWYEAYSATAVTDPKGPATGEGRVLRGGSRLDRADHCRSAARFLNVPDFRNWGYGFRVSLEA